ncbi:MAG: tetratricopeptide repeat protein [Pseudomonadota bacterium]
MAHDKSGSTGAAQQHYKLGCELEAAEQLVQALAAYDEAIRLSPDFAKAHNNRGSVLHQFGRLDEALDSYKEAQRLDPGLWNASYNVGLALKMQGRFSDAIAPFQQAMRTRRAPDGNARELDPADTRTTLFKLRHDIEQIEYLLRLKRIDGSFLQLSDSLGECVQAIEAAGNPPRDGWEFPQAVHPALAPRYNKLHHFHDAPAIKGGALNPKVDWKRVEAGYFERAPGMAFVDDFMVPEALEGLRRFALESTIWFDCNYSGGYVGCTAEDGFICPLLVQVAEEMKAALPAIIGPHPLNGMWGYKYDSQGSGINPHADFAAVNVNFWITPDASNTDHSSGGLVVWDKEAPLDWNFQDYNNNPQKIHAFLDQAGAASWAVPYRQNRMVLFNSDLVHKPTSTSSSPVMRIAG